MKYNVLSEGPSIFRVNPSDLLDGSTVAVNRAILAKRWLPVSIWASFDQPKPSIKSLDPLAEGMEILGRAQAQLGKAHGRMPRLERYVRSLGEPTIVLTLLELLGRREASHIRVFGADMVGSGSPFVGELLVPQSKRDASLWRPNAQADHRRWTLESKALDAISRICETGDSVGGRCCEGVVLEFFQPGPSPEAEQRMKRAQREFVEVYRAHTRELRRTCST